jgi:hypothetical protein
MGKDIPTILKEIIKNSFEEINTAKKSFIGSDLKDSTRVSLNQMFSFASDEIILFGGYYTMPASKLGLVITDKKLHYRVSSGLFGFPKTKSQDLKTIYSLDIGWGKGKGEGLRFNVTGADLVINGLGCGNFAGFSLPDEDEKLLSNIFNKISSVNLTKF